MKNEAWGEVQVLELIIEFMVLNQTVHPSHLWRLLS